MYNLNEEMRYYLTKISEDYNNGGKIFGIKIACEGGIND